jgi:hypothetical protein
VFVPETECGAYEGYRTKARFGWMAIEAQCKGNQSSSSSSTQSSASSTGKGCIEVIKETFNPNGQILNPTAQFTFRMEGQVRVNDGSGRVKFENINPGWHTVTEDIPSGWTQMSVTPNLGQVHVQAGNACAVVVFKNKQIVGSSASSQSSQSSQGSQTSQSSVPMGCIDVVKETFDVNGNLMNPTAAFTFRMEGRAQVSDSNGRTRFENVYPGVRTVTEDIPGGWQQINVTPNNGQVTVQPGGNCAVIVFKNRLVSQQSSSSRRSYECSDNIDNDGDGRTDYPNDEGCYGWEDDDEYNKKHSSSRSSKRRRTGDFVVTKEASASEVFPNGTVEFTIEIENDTGEDLEDIEVVDDYPEEDIRITDDDDADDDDGDELRWTISHLDDGDTETITYRAKLKSGARRGDRVCNEVFVSAEGEDDGYEDEADACVSVIEDLPQTGGRNQAGGSSFLKPISSASEGNALPLGIWVVLASIGTSAGAFVAKKYWL